MRSQTLRRAAATLFVAAAVTLTCATPSRALWDQPHGGVSEDPVREQPGRSFVAFLLPLFGFAGGAMDPNGSH
jgi:hypothetical protein